MSEPTTLANALETVINRLELQQSHAHKLCRQEGYKEATRRALELIEDGIVTDCDCRICNKLEQLAHELREQAANL
jgi:hypothetical protein